MSSTIERVQNKDMECMAAFNRLYKVISETTMYKNGSLRSKKVFAFERRMSLFYDHKWFLDVRRDVCGSSTLFSKEILVHGIDSLITTCAEIMKCRIFSHDSYNKAMLMSHEAIDILRNFPDYREDAISLLFIRNMEREQR